VCCTPAGGVWNPHVKVTFTFSHPSGNGVFLRSTIPAFIGVSVSYAVGSFSRYSLESMADPLISIEEIDRTGWPGSLSSPFSESFTRPFPSISTVSSG